ncbi:MAG: hypothetical protein IJR44_00575 [Neisseriaceae bacterium]|nr:hypothetical protein [Neisseriaceae bacterium]
MSIQTKITEICQQYAKEQQGKQEIDYRALADLNRNISDLQVEFSMENIMKQFAVFERSHRMQMAAIEKAHNSQMASMEKTQKTLYWVMGLTVPALLGLMGIILTVLLTK